MIRLLATILLLPLPLWIGIRVYRAVVFKIECSGHIKRAADANTTELASQEMKVVVDYLEQHSMTSGYTSVLYRTPDEDVGFWYINLKSSLEELKKVKTGTSQLERSNLLLKLRQTLLDQKEMGESVTTPKGISIFPHNTAFAFFGIFGHGAFALGILLWASPLFKLFKPSGNS
ncbi:MAG: hypothetical protein A2908_00980 [Candidatus Staskawiczbacteria bacterium RIFCSPLOWO2_01_FULL_38_12b]|uniref:Uncharacterized protein n=1 Tax=Candidatus Staskawiczbacteria bacterium RIFCSPLOWO2_01_FULL_38_12b TaxID=1802214 RepID=A0A1G2IC28_9BACT|nr:MAG: hypothetical protein A2908_00980 [Candidatus Staskawiczbacteria bacterium RIFCSPLOWO2_01_FULL_38_12b]